MTLGPLLESDLDKSPFAQFARWFEEAKQKQPQLAEAMTVSTCGSDGVVSARVCLLKSFDAHGFVFYTNYNSRKGTQISENPRLSLCFFWPGLERSVRVEGVAVKTTAEEADAYFATRPRGSQLGAWASSQSSVIPGRGDLDQRFRELEANYRDRPVPRPPHWGGYRVIPVEIEFWQGRQDRLHDRFVYRLREPKDWVIERLSP
ncbi:MAG TPA: pyridoxamine 5'-phosphate oxidase [Thermoanaerobaculia bacterium]|nr:pyridoxamine 5'-phosphate oxidase [Thermoanaerobaculia bacterium]